MSISFTQNTQSIIKDALFDINAISPGDIIESEDYELAKRALNRLIKRWQRNGISLWTYTQGYIFPQKGQDKYTFGTGSTDHFTNTAYFTEMATAGVASDTTLIVDDTSDMTAGDYIGIELDTGYRQWTTVASVTNATHVVIDDALTDSVAVDNNIINYTTKADWPLHIDNVRYYLESSSIETPMDRLSRADYFNIANKVVTQRTSVWFYDVQKNPGYFYIWPQIQQIRDYYTVTYQRVIHDVNDPTDNVDFPAEWLDAIIMNLGVRLSHPMKTQATPEYRADAERAYLDAKAMNQEMEYLEVDRDNSN